MKHTAAYARTFPPLVCVVYNVLARKVRTAFGLQMAASLQKLALDRFSKTSTLSKI